MAATTGTTAASANAQAVPFTVAQASLDDLQGLYDDQLALFDEYRLQYGDTFTIAIAEHPEWTTDVSVLDDGRIYFGFLGRSVNVLGMTFDEIVDILVFGTPPSRPCPNCGYVYDRDDASCPACGADPDHVEATAEVVLQQGNINEISRLGGILGPDADPVRPVVGQEDRFVILCAQGLMGVRAVLGTPALRLWTLPLGDLQIPDPLADRPALPAAFPVLARGEWVQVDALTGETTPIEAPEAVTLSPTGFPPPPKGNGLNTIILKPRLMVSNIRLAPTSNTIKVLGAVNTPGRVRMIPGYRLWDAINDANGPQVVASDTRLRYGQTPEVPLVDWSAAVLLREARYLPESMLPAGTRPEDVIRLAVDFERLARGDPAQNVPLFPGDIVYIPEYAPAVTRVAVVGRLPRSNLYYFQDDITLIGALASAGWMIEAEAEYSGVYLIRDPLREDDVRAVYVIDTMDIVHGQARDIPLHDGDIVYVDTDPLQVFNEQLLSKLLPFFAVADASATASRDWRDLVNGD